MKLKFFLIIVVVFFISFISASFEKGDFTYDLDEQYNVNNIIKGWINISLSEEDLDSNFETSEGDKISLRELLKLNNLYDECEIPNCEIDYDSINAESTKTIDLIGGESKILGFKFDANLQSVDSVDFKISSDATESCNDPLKIDIFNDGSKDIERISSTINFCSIFRTKGCFDEEKNLDYGNDNDFVYISSTPVCQKVSLPESLGIRLGAELKVIGETKKIVNFALYDLDGSTIGGCSNDSVVGVGEFYCDVTSVNLDETKEYYMCVTGNTENNIKIKYYQDNENGCGFYGNPPGEENYSYNLIAYSMRFGNVGEFMISDKYDGNFLINVNSYLESRYNSLECSVKKCIIPIKFYPKEDQQIILSELSGIISTSGGPRSISSNFYDLEEIQLKYNSDFKQIFLNNASFKLPKGYGNQTFWLKFNEEEIFSQNVFILGTPNIRSLSPFITAATVLTEFHVNVNTPISNTNIIKYKWDFGNGDKDETINSTVKYIYNSTGTFNLTVSVFDSNQLNSSRIFNILVETPVDAVDATLSKKLKSLENIKKEILIFSEFEKNSLNTLLDLIEIENKLVEIKTRFDSAVPGVADSYYVDLIMDLFKINLPIFTGISKSADKLSFYFSEDKINLNALALLEGEYLIGKEQEYKDAILYWSLNNLVSTIGYKEISVDYGNGIETLLNVFELSVNEKIDSEKKSYLIFKKIDGLKFEKNYDKREIDDYIFIPLDDTSKIIFSVTEDIDFSELPLFISPTIDNLNVFESTFEEEKISKEILILLIVILLILVTVVGYVILQKWYSKKYENYLFKNKNDLYNLISFIEHSKKKGVDENKIVKSLKKSGWSGEQRRYIIRKYLGKRTGMFTINFGNIFKKKKIISHVNLQRKPFQKVGFNPGVKRK